MVGSAQQAVDHDVAERSTRDRSRDALSRQIDGGVPATGMKKQSDERGGRSSTRLISSQVNVAAPNSCLDVVADRSPELGRDQRTAASVEFTSRDEHEVGRQPSEDGLRS